MVNWAQHGIATRAVVLDIPAVRGVDWVAAGAPVTAAELEAALAAAGGVFHPGDALVIYQGRDRYEAAGNIYPSGAAAVTRPGIGQDGAIWIAAKEPGLVLWDFHDARDNPAGSLEVHNLIYAIGLCLVDNCLLGPAVAALKAAGSLDRAHRGRPDRDPPLDRRADQPAAAVLTPVAPASRSPYSQVGALSFTYSI